MSEDPRLLRDFSLTLDLMAMAMEAGLDLNGAVDRAISVMPDGPLHALWSQSQVQIALGKKRTDCLRELHQATGLREFLSLEQAVALSETLGGNLAGALRLLAETVRDRRYARAEQAAQEIPVKLIFPLVFLIFPNVMAVLFAPLLYRFFSLGFS